MLRICKDGKKKYQSLGISVLPRYWDFTRNKPKPNCPNKEYIQKIILDKQTELQQRVLEFNSEQKEYTTTTLLNDKNKKFELKTVCQFYQELIEQYKNNDKCGNRLIYKSSYNSLKVFTKNQLDIPFSAITLVNDNTSNLAKTYLFSVICVAALILQTSQIWQKPISQMAGYTIYVRKQANW